MENQYQFSASTKKNIFITGIVGLILTLLGIIFLSLDKGHYDNHGHNDHSAIQELSIKQVNNNSNHSIANFNNNSTKGEEGGHAYHWIYRVFSNLWINNMFFLGLAIIGAFFVAIQYVAQVGWSAQLIRVPTAMFSALPIISLLVIVVWVIAMPSHALFHWLDPSLVDKGSPNFDEIINGKKAYLNVPFYLGRMIIILACWYLLFKMIKRNSLKEDTIGGNDLWRSNIKWSAGFIVFFGYTSSIGAWDWIMSIDPHWFSTMFGWYIFASWWVSGLAFITLVLVFLKEAGYFPKLNSEHFHDLGKFIWGFSIFWCYIWFSQFLLIYYANIPEETTYFIDRLQSDKYGNLIIVNLILNFFLPFLLLMTRNSKRTLLFLKIVCSIILIGHWLDFYLMISPGTLKENGGIAFLEIGLFLVYGALFLFITLNSLSKHKLIPSKHPLLEESYHHHT